MFWSLRCKDRNKYLFGLSVGENTFFVFYISKFHTPNDQSRKEICRVLKKEENCLLQAVLLYTDMIYEDVAVEEGILGKKKVTFL